MNAEVKTRGEDKLLSVHRSAFLLDLWGAHLCVEGKFGGDDRVVAAGVAEVRARFDGRAGELQVVEVGDATDNRVVPAHERDRLRVVGHVDLRGCEFLAPHGGHDGVCTLRVDVGDGAHVRRVVREIVSRAESDAPRAGYENLQAILARRPRAYFAAPVSAGWLSLLWP